MTLLYTSRYLTELSVLYIIILYWSGRSKRAFLFTRIILIYVLIFTLNILEIGYHSSTCLRLMRHLTHLQINKLLHLL